jgi:outer membrane lipoprotein SlyB
MKAIVIPAALAIVMTATVAGSTPASAKGCLKGAVIGGVAGHFLGHHGWLGAGAGCVIGHHEAAKHERERERAYHEGYGSSGPPSDRGYGPHP